MVINNVIEDPMNSFLTPFCKFEKEFYKSVFHSSEFINNFFIIHQNIRSLRKNFDVFLAHLESFLNKPALIFLSEIWIYENEKVFL